MGFVVEHKFLLSTCNFRLFSSLFWTEQCVETITRDRSQSLNKNWDNFKDDLFSSVFLKKELAEGVAASKPDGINVDLKPEDFVITVRKKKVIINLELDNDNLKNFWISLFIMIL